MTKEEKDNKIIWHISNIWYIRFFLNFLIQSYDLNHFLWQNI